MAADEVAQNADYAPEECHAQGVKDGAHISHCGVVPHLVKGALRRARWPFRGQARVTGASSPDAVFPRRRC
jgi:hypothetical protein